MSSSWPKPSSASAPTGEGGNGSSEKTPPAIHSTLINSARDSEGSTAQTPISDTEGASGTEEPFSLEEATVLCHLEKGDCIGEMNVMKALERDKKRYFWLTRFEIF